MKKKFSNFARYGITGFVILIMLTSSASMANSLTANNQTSTNITGLQTINLVSPTSKEINTVSSTTDTSTKLDSVLSDWVSNNVLPDKGINYIDNKVSIMMMVDGDPTLGGLVHPLGSVALPNGFYYVQTTVANVKELNLLKANPRVVKVEVDQSAIETNNNQSSNTLNGIAKEIPVQSDISLPSPDIAKYLVTPDTYASREILGVQDVWDGGINGSGVIVDLQDTGLDFGHTVYKGVMAKDSEGNPLSLEPSGRMTITSLWSKSYWLNYGYNLSVFDPLHAQLINGSYYIDVKGWQNMKVFDADHAQLWSAYQLGLDIPNYWKIGTASPLPGDTTGYAFGISMIYNGGTPEFVPFIEADANGDGKYDTLYVDFVTGYAITTAWFATTQADYDLWDSRATWDFSIAVAHTNVNNQELGADVRNPYTWGVPDGYNDISLGGLSNCYDIYGLSGNTIPIVKGIDTNGMCFAHIWDTGGHGTGCAGYIAAQPTQYAVLNVTDGHPNDTMYNMEGMAPGARILSTPGLSSSATYYGWLWAAGFEPDENYIWSFHPGCAHIANISSNSWGYSSVDLGNIATGWDFETMFIDLLSTPNFIAPGYPGILFLDSSGNGGAGMGTMKQPGQSTACLTIGASTTNQWRQVYGYNATPSQQGQDQVISWSDNGPSVIGYPKIDLVAPGAFDLSFVPVTVGGNDDWTNYYFIEVFGGTSASCPVVAGAAALLYSAWETAHPGVSLSPDLAKVILKSSATDLGYDAYMQGAGRVNAKAAVEIANGTSNAIYAYSTDATKIAAQRYEASYYKYFNRTSYFGTDELSDVNASGNYDQYPGFTENIKDDAAYFGSVFPSDTAMNQINIVGNTTDVSIQAVTMTTTYSAVNDTLTTANLEQGVDFKDQGYYPIKLADLFDFSQIQAGTYMQLTFSQTQAVSDQYLANGTYQPIMYISTLLSGDPLVDPIWSFDNYAYAHGGNFQTLFLPVDQLSTYTYVRIRDFAFAANLAMNWTFTGLPFSMSCRVFNRTSDSNIALDVGTDHFNATLTVPGNAVGGMYEGYFIITGGLQPVLVPYGYSVVTTVTNYEDDGWTTISDGTLTNRPNDNGVYGCYDYSWRAETGDWRYYDIYLDNSSYDHSDMMSLALDLEWTNPGSEMNMWVVDHEGYVIARTDYSVSGGQYLSNINAPSTHQYLLQSIEGYSSTDPYHIYYNGWSENVTTGLGYDEFTVIVHANKLDPTSATLPIEPFTLKAAWINSSTDDFTTPQLTMSGQEKVVGGTYFTEGSIGATWSNVSTNPIPDFANNQYATTITLSKATFYSKEYTIPAADIVQYAGAIVPEWTHDFNLIKGQYVTGDLNWDDPNIDYDLLLIPYGEDITYDNDVFHGAASSSAKPEHFEGYIPATGEYILVVEYFAGPGVASTFDVAFNVLGDPVYITTGEVGTTSLYNFIANNAEEGAYLLTTSTYGWNFARTMSEKVFYYKEDTAPNVAFTITGDNLYLRDGAQVTFVNKSLSFTATGAFGNAPYDISWDMGDGSAIMSTANVTHSYDAAGTYNISITVVDVDGQTSTYSKTLIVEVDSQPSATFTANVTTINETESITFTEGTTGGNMPLVHLWNFGDNSTLTATTSTVSHTFATSGNYTVTLTVTDLNGDTSTFSMVIHVNVPTAQPKPGIPGYGLGLIGLVSVAVLTLIIKKKRT